MSLEEQKKTMDMYLAELDDDENNPKPKLLSKPAAPISKETP